MSCLRICLCLFFLLFSCHFSWAAEVNFSWLPNSESDIAGYRLYYGTSSRNYDDFVNISPEPDGGQVYGTVSVPDDSQTYYFAVTAYTDEAESDFSSEIVYCIGCYSTGLPHLETGEVTLTQAWTRVDFTSSFTQPVVVAKMISYNGSGPSIVRIRNVDKTGFDIRIQEWDYLDGVHTGEVVSYIVMEQGTYILKNGTRIEAGTFTTSATLSFGQQEFNQVFNTSPVVITSIATYNGEQAVTGRMSGINPNGFQYMMQEQQANNDGHAQEAVSYIAWERSDGTVDGITYAVGNTGEKVTAYFVLSGYRAVNRAEFQVAPVVVTDMLTTNGLDVAALRCQNNSRTTFQVKVEEEQSLDTETFHTAENVGYIAISNNTIPPLEAGEIEVDHNWVRVEFESNFYQPVVVAKMITNNGSAPCVVRLRNTDNTGFDVRVQEWEYLDGVHTKEVISYLVMEQGDYTLENGTRIEAGIFETFATESFKQQEFNMDFNSFPVVVTSIVSCNGGQTVTGRMKGIDKYGFEYLMQEQEANSEGHSQETISYIAWERSDGTSGDIAYAVGSTGERVKSDFVWSSYRAEFQIAPVVVADMLTTNGMDVAALRCQKNGASSFQVKVEEEQSFDSEVGHAPEDVGYIAVMDD